MADKLTNSNNQIENGLRADVMRKSMENKNLLKDKGSIYVGTGEKETIVVQGENVSVAKTDALPVGETNQVLKVKNGTVEYGFVDADSFGTDQVSLPNTVKVTENNLTGTISADKLKDLVNSDWSHVSIGPFGTLSIAQKNTDTGQLGIMFAQSSDLQKIIAYQGTTTDYQGGTYATRYSAVSLIGSDRSDFLEGNHWAVYLDIYNASTEFGYCVIPLGTFIIPKYHSGSGSPIHLHQVYYENLTCIYDFNLQLTPYLTGMSTGPGWGFSGKLYCSEVDRTLITYTTSSRKLRLSDSFYTSDTLSEIVEAITGSKDYSASIFFVNLDALQNKIKS